MVCGGRVEPDEATKGEVVAEPRRRIPKLRQRHIRSNVPKFALINLPFRSEPNILAAAVRGNLKQIGFFFIYVC